MDTDIAVGDWGANLEVDSSFNLLISILISRQESKAAFLFFEGIRINTFLENSSET